MDYLSSTWCSLRWHVTEFKASFLVGTDDYQIEAAQANDAIAEIPSRLNTQIEIWGLEGKESTGAGPRP